MKVFIHPTWKKPDKLGDGGIRRVSDAQNMLLPEFGIEIAPDPRQADLIATHGTSHLVVPDKPIVNHNHGLYWDIYAWPDWAHEANKNVRIAMAQAIAHTAPSHWVATALRRGMLVYPEVVYHGVDPDIWKPPEGDWNQFVLWNKARADFVSNPDDMQTLAAMMPDVKFVSTLGRQTNNLDVVGTMGHNEMFDWVQHAGLYLCTARETFGIGTLEAMACGVPVVGWDWGGQREIIIHGETGFLAKPHDYEALAEGVRWAISNREKLSENARQDVLDRWTWKPRIAQYAEIYRRTLEHWNYPSCKVSVIVTCHNLAHYLDDCLESVIGQDLQDWECLIVDDASTDETKAVALKWAERDDRFRYIKTPENLKLSGARNFGFANSKGRYIQWLDADDMLGDYALSLHANLLDSDPGVHISYGHLDMVDDDGGNRRRGSWPFKEFNWYGQMAHMNQLPYAAMMRREVLERSGGYRVRHWRAEDAAFWCSVTSKGFVAKKATEASTLIYRMRGDSKGSQEDSDGDWTAWFPWRMGFSTHTRSAQAAANAKHHPNPELIPWGAQGEPTGQRFWGIPDHTNPLVSIIIPVGPKHAGVAIDALESVEGSIFQDWECIIVNATGKEWPDGFNSPIAGAPWAVLVNNGGPQLRPAVARNMGAEFATGEALLWLDADDLLLPNALNEMVSLYRGTEGGLIYTDWLRGDSDPEKPLIPYETQEFECGKVLQKMQHAMMCLVPRWAHEKIGGFDPAMPGWEDWDYLIALQSIGLCSYRAEIPGFVYRFRKGTIREESFGRRKETLELIRKKWRDYYEGKKQMGCGCKGKRKAALVKSKQEAVLATGGATHVKLEYQGPHVGKHTVRGPISGKNYRFAKGTQSWVRAEDAPEMMAKTRRGVPDFVKVESTKADHADLVPKHAPPQAAEAEFPTMPDSEQVVAAHQTSEAVPDIGSLTVEKLREAVKIADDPTMIEWMAAERAGKQRKTVLSIIEAEMNKRAKTE